MAAQRRGWLACTAVPSTGAALLLANQVDRPNFGLTLDIGHMLMAGENPAQSVALVGTAGNPLRSAARNGGHTQLTHSLSLALSLAL